MKIIDTDNFGGDYPNEKVMAEKVFNKIVGQAMVDGLNTALSGEYAPRFYKLVEDDYILKGGFEP